MSAAEDVPATPATPRTTRRRPWLAALLSLLAPGAGQFYNGVARLGWMLFAAFAGLDVIFLVVLPMLPLRALVALYLPIALAELGLRIGSAIQAYRAARPLGTTPRRGYQRVWVYVLLIIALPAVNLAAFPKFSVRSFYTPSTAMTPTLLIGDYFIVDTGYYASRAPRRGDVVVYRMPKNPSVDYIKRIAGLPGDRVQMRAGRLFINDEIVPQRQIDDYQAVSDGAAVHFQQYIEALPRQAGQPALEHRIVKLGDAAPPQLNDTAVFEVPPANYFTMGDNRDNSVDSRMLDTHGYVPAANLIGHVEFVTFSSDGSAHWWQVWKWPTAIRYGRLFRGVM